MRKLLLLGQILCALTVCGQENLIADSSFEDYSYFPTSYIGDPTLFNKILPNWYAPTNGTPDYFNIDNSSLRVGLPRNSRDVSGSPLPVCANFQLPRTGKGCAGFGVVRDTKYKINEYVQAKLLKPMAKNHVYAISFYVNRSHCSYMGFTNIGAYISQDSIRQFYPNPDDYPNYSNFGTPYQPQIRNTDSILSDTSNWLKISGLYKAKGGEQWTTIGHYNSDNEVLVFYDTFGNMYSFAYYFIDDVSFYERTGVIYPDTVCKGEIVEFTSNRQGSFSWYKDGILLSNDSIYRFKADKSGTYILKTPTSSDTFIFVVNEEAYFNLGNDTFLCFGDTIIKDVKVHNALFIWDDFVNGTSSARPIIFGRTYALTAITANCKFIDTINIEHRVKPTLKPYSVIEYCSVDSTFVTVTLDPFYSYFWDYFQDTQRIQYITNPGTYSIKISDNGCTVKETVTVEDFCTPIMWVPNAFVPKGINTVFAPKGHYIKDYSMSIYNRWGEKLYEQSNTPWDGIYKNELCTMGIYVYKLEYTGFNNKTYSMKGVFELIE